MITLLDLDNKFSFSDIVGTPTVIAVADQAARDALTLIPTGTVVRYPDGVLEVYKKELNSWTVISSSGGVGVPAGAIRTQEYQLGWYSQGSVVSYQGIHYVTFLDTEAVPPAAPWRIAKLGARYHNPTPIDLTLNGDADITIDQLGTYETQGVTVDATAYYTAGEDAALEDGAAEVSITPPSTSCGDGGDGGDGDGDAVNDRPDTSGDAAACVTRTVNQTSDTTAEETFSTTTSDGVNTTVTRNITMTVPHIHDIPRIGLHGEEPQSVFVGSPYIEAGATALAYDDTVLTVNISGTVNTDVEGTYYVTYSATDADGLTYQVKRTVVVTNSVAVIPERGFPLMWFTPRNVGVTCDGGASHVNYYVRFRASYGGSAANITAIEVEGLGSIPVSAAETAAGLAFVTDKACTRDAGGALVCGGVQAPKWFVASAAKDIRPYNITFTCSDNTTHTITFTPLRRMWVIW